jgi:hypothetical protein
MSACFEIVRFAIALVMNSSTPVMVLSILALPGVVLLSSFTGDRLFRIYAQLTTAAAGLALSLLLMKILQAAAA